jgi:hypothetical protein
MADLEISKAYFLLQRVPDDIILIFVLFLQSNFLNLRILACMGRAQSFITEE